MTGIEPFDLAAEFCEECGYFKGKRLFGYLSGCSLCDAVIRRDGLKPFQPFRRPLWTR